MSLARNVGLSSEIVIKYLLGKAWSQQTLTAIKQKMVNHGLGDPNSRVCVF